MHKPKSITFIPDSELKERVNKPFAAFDTVAITEEQADELAKFESVDVSDDPILEEYQSFFMEQVFSAAHDEDMVSTYELSTYRNSIAELLFRAGIVRDSKPKASYIADLGFRTSNKVLSEFHFVDYELSNAE